MLRQAIRTTLCGFVIAASFQVAAETQRFPSEAGQVTVKEIAAGLENPWGLAFLPDGEHMLVTERPGRLRLVGLDGSRSEPLAGVPDVFARAQGGLLDVRLSPAFEQDRLVYLSYAEVGEDGKAGTAVGRGRLSDDRSRLENFEVIFRQLPKLSSGIHFGSRLVFDGNGHLFVALGENNQRSTSQDLDKHQGKVVRIGLDGSVPDDNPFVGRDGVRPEIWSYGHRNQQGAALNPWSGVLWTHEHGPRGGDEINIPQAGKNYGWPLATFGIDYTGARVSPYTELPGLTAPLLHWTPSVAPSSLTLYRGELFPEWQDDLFAATLAERSVRRIRVRDGMLAGEEILFEELGERIRDVRSGPDGALYLLTDSPQGRLLRVVPSE